MNGRLPRSVRSRRGGHPRNDQRRVRVFDIQASSFARIVRFGFDEVRVSRRDRSVLGPSTLWNKPADLEAALRPEVECRPIDSGLPPAIILATPSEDFITVHNNYTAKLCPLRKWNESLHAGRLKGSASITNP